MRKKITALLITAFLTTSPFGTAFAAEAENVNSVAGITPDSIFYSVERTVEKIQLVLTSDPVKTVTLLTDNAEERLAEAQVMNEEDKVELAEQAANEYTTTVDQVSQIIQTAVEQANAEDVSNTTTGTTTGATTGTTTETTTGTTSTTTGTTTDTTTPTTGGVNQDGMNAVLAELLKKNEELQKKSVNVLASLLDKLPENAQKAITAVIVKQVLHTEAVRNYVEAKKEYNKDRNSETKAKLEAAIKAKKEIKSVIETKLAEINAEGSVEVLGSAESGEQNAEDNEIMESLEKVKDKVEKDLKAKKDVQEKKLEVEKKAEDQKKAEEKKIEIEEKKLETQKKVEKKKKEAQQKVEEKVKEDQKKKGNN